MPREPEIETVLVCDDIREEITHKLILIGVYSGNFVVPEFPSNFFLAFYFTMTANDPGEFELNLRLSLPKTRPEMYMRVKFAVPALEDTSLAGDQFGTFTPKIPITIPAPGELVLSARWGEQGKFRPVLRKSIILAPPGG